MPQQTGTQSMPLADLTPHMSPWTPDMFSLVLYTALVVLLIAVILFLAARLGRRRPGLEKDRAYECGIIPAPRDGLPLPVPFYLVALFFLVFDVEGAYIFSWAIALRELGWLGWLQVTFFIIMLLASLIYLWAKGGLEWKKKEMQ